MRELLPAIERWRAEGKAIALATVVKIYGSAPQPLGAKMAISEDGGMAGSVSGGCVEGAVVQEALAIVKEGKPQLIPYGISDDWAATAGLACGGQIEVFVEPLGLAANREAEAVHRKEVAAGRLVASATVIQGPGLGGKLTLEPSGGREGSTGNAVLDEEIARRGPAILQRQVSERLRIDIKGQPSEVFVDVSGPPERLIIVGGVHTAIPLVTFAKALGFHTTVVDARGAFATPQRFPHVDDLVVRWPADHLAELALDEGSYVVFLTHDAKIDNPALMVAFNSPARYIGALGSRHTHAERVAALQELGATPEQLVRIHAPIGLDLGGRRPEEVAVAIIAQIVAIRNARIQLEVAR